MNNANAVMACVWCGAAFLRGLVVKLQPERGIQLSMRLALPRRNDEGSTGITEGPIFRGVSRHGVLLGRLSGRGVARVVQHTAAAVGLEASTFGGHSLRAGLATAAAKAGKSERAIMAQTGHRSVTMVRRYIREASVFTDNAAAGLL